MHGMTDIIGLIILIGGARSFLMGGSGSMTLGSRSSATALASTSNDVDDEERRTDEYFRGHEYGDREAYTRDLPREPGDLPW